MDIINLVNNLVESIAVRKDLQNEVIKYNNPGQVLTLKSSDNSNPTHNYVSVRDFYATNYIHTILRVSCIFKKGSKTLGNREYSTKNKAAETKANIESNTINATPNSNYYTAESDVYEIPGMGKERVVNILQQIKAATDGYYTNITKHFLENPDFLKFAYHLIKNKPGNLTPSATYETLDGISSNWFEKAAKDIQLNKYQFKQAKKIEIPKPGKFDKRILIIGNPRDKIIQKAMQLILNEIYEIKEKSYFSDKSHGFRPNRSCHTALETIKKS